MLHIGSMFNPKISFTSSYEDNLDTWAEVFCWQTTQTGVNKQVSNNSSIEFCQTVMEGIRSYHNTVLAGFKINKNIKTI